jgi:hypothetical protein
MTKNQKIALGCGGAGCLGLIVVVIAAGVIWSLTYRRSVSISRDYDYNVNSNTNSNSNSSYESDSNSNANSNSNSGISISSMSSDDKHKLFQAATMTGDSELINRVNVKIGLLNEDFTPGEEYNRFMGEHIGWGARNYAFIQSINTPEKARAYVNEHFPE